MDVVTAPVPPERARDGRIFLVKMERTQERMVTMTAADHDDAMADAEQVFPGWTSIEATEDEW